MIEVNFDTTELKKQLDKFAKDIQDQAIRSAAFAASKVIYEEMKIRVPVGKTGNLKTAIYQFHHTGEVAGKHIYSIGPNKKKGKGSHWHLIEYGHWQTNVLFKLPNGEFRASKKKLPVPVWVPAKPFIRPTYDAKITAAMQAATTRLQEKIKEIIDA